jgi:TldD protein
VLLVQSSDAETPAALKQRVVQMITEQGKPYGYRVETLGPGNTPRLLYRIYPDGHEELVRGAVFNELDVRALRSDLLAVGDDPLASNRGGGGVATTVISPSILFDELEVKRADTSKDKLPDYPAPPLGKQ